MMSPMCKSKELMELHFFNIYRRRTSKTFGEYCDDELVKVVYCFPEGVDRMNFVLTGIYRTTLRRRAVKEEEKKCAFQ